MKSRKLLFRLIIGIIILHLFANKLISQDSETITINVNGQHYESHHVAVDEFAIVSSRGISWLKITDNSIGDIWENSGRILYDGVPVIGFTKVCPKRKLTVLGRVLQ